MSVWTREELAEHEEHDIKVTVYAGGESVTVDCMDCHMVLVSMEDIEKITQSEDEIRQAEGIT